MKLNNFYNQEINNLFKVIRIVFANEKNERKKLLTLLRYQKKAINKRKLYEKKTGLHIPILLLISVTERCNLKCKGCYSNAIKNNKIAQENFLQMIIKEYLMKQTSLEFP